MKVRFAPSARAQFLAAVEFIHQEKPLAAAKFRAQVEKSLRRLPRFPRLGSAIPEFPALPHRQLIVAPYRFFYRIAGDTIWIVAVWHAAQRTARPR